MHAVHGHVLISWFSTVMYCFLVAFYFFLPNFFFLDFLKHLIIFGYRILDHQILPWICRQPFWPKVSTGDSVGQKPDRPLRKLLDMMSYSRAWPTTSGMPAAAGPIAPASTSQVLSGVPNNGPNNVGNNVQNVQPVMCQPVQPLQRQNKET